MFEKSLSGVQSNALDFSFRRFVFAFSTEKPLMRIRFGSEPAVFLFSNDVVLFTHNYS